MVLLCDGVEIVNQPKDTPANVCNSVVAAVADALAAAPAATPLAQQTATPITGDDTSILTILQREAGVVVADETNATTGAPTAIASIDATTCIVVAVRDPVSKRVAMAHFDTAEPQATDGVDLLGRMALNEREGASDAGQEKSSGRSQKPTTTQPLQTYMLGAVKDAPKSDKYSSETMAAVVRAMSAHGRYTFELVPSGVCVWTQNSKSMGKLIHSSLMVDAATGNCCPVEMSPERAYPGGRLRALRCFDDADQLVSPITLLPGESVVDAAAAQGTDATPFLLVRPFKWPVFPSQVAQLPMSYSRR